MQRDLIAFTGFKGSGKNTAASSIHNRCEESFASPIREIAEIVFDLDYEEMHDRELKELQLERWPYQSPREILRNVGMMFRDSYPGAWINIMRRRYEDNRRYGYTTVITDLRFEDEEKAIREMGGYIVRVHRPGATDENDPHPSEAYVPFIKADLELINNCESAEDFAELVYDELAELEII